MITYSKLVYSLFFTVYSIDSSPDDRENSFEYKKRNQDYIDIKNLVVLRFLKIFARLQ